LPFILLANQFPQHIENELQTLERPIPVLSSRKPYLIWTCTTPLEPMGFKHCPRKLGLIGNKIIQLPLEVLEGRAMPEGLNGTLLVLIPKIENPHKVIQL